jgi:hypothetical protein
MTRWIEIIRLACLSTILSSSSCSRSNNLFLGTVEAPVDGHTVVVTDCYRLTVPPPQKIDDAADGYSTYRFLPCRDAVVVIRSGELFVNGKSYGPLRPQDDVLVDHGFVYFKPRETAPAAGK